MVRHAQAFNTPPPKREGPGELVVGLWGHPPSPSDKVTMIRQSSLTRLGVMINTAVNKRSSHPGNGDIQWCFSQVKGTLDDDVTEADPCSSPTDVLDPLVPDLLNFYEDSYFRNGIAIGLSPGYKTCM
uniref:Uncharacterized protein n=1 Tax=Graphocephala atropunctata TaxID=36148 RepID=A0A1B6KL11_9HEMI